MKRCILIVCFAFSSIANAAILPFELPWMNAEEPGTTYKSSDHPGAVFVLEVFGLNCSYCNDNVPRVHSLVKFYESNKLVQILDVGTDTSDTNYFRWIDRHHPTYPVLKDATRSIYKQLGTSGIPSTAVVDCTGKLQHVSMGVWSSSTVANIKAAVARSLALPACKVQE